MKKVIIMLLVSIFTFSFISVNAKSYGYGIKKESKYVIPDPGSEVTQILARHNAHYIGDTSEKTIYLTFDAGYENGNTAVILDVLYKKNITATFFLTGHYFKSAPEYVLRMVNEGHLICNHSYGHIDMTKSSKAEITDDLNKLNAEYFKLTGEKMCNIVRPPEGTFSDESLSILDELGYHTMFWSITYKDWLQNEQKGYKYAYDNVVGRIHNGAVILMHTVSEDNVDALPMIIDDLQNEGFVFSTVLDLVQKANN